MQPGPARQRSAAGSGCCTGLRMQPAEAVDVGVADHGGKAATVSTMAAVRIPYGLVGVRWSPS